MGTKSVDEKFSMALARVRGEVGTMIEMSARFDVLVAQSASRAAGYDVEALARYLNAAVTLPGQRARLLAMLASHPDAIAAREVVVNWQPPEQDRELALFSKLAALALARAVSEGDSSALAS